MHARLFSNTDYIVRITTAKEIFKLENKNEQNYVN